jgi:hypothetical protein
MVTISSALSASSELSISVRTGLGARRSAAFALAAGRPDARRAAGRLAPVPGRAVMVDVGILRIVRLLGWWLFWSADS